MNESPDFWGGFEAALNLIDIEIDKLLGSVTSHSTVYDTLLEAKLAVRQINSMTPEKEPLLDLSMD